MRGVVPSRAAASRPPLKSPSRTSAPPPPSAPKLPAAIPVSGLAEPRSTPGKRADDLRCSPPSRNRPARQATRREPRPRARLHGSEAWRAYPMVCTSASLGIWRRANRSFSRANRAALLKARLRLGAERFHALRRFRIKPQWPTPARRARGTGHGGCWHPTGRRRARQARARAGGFPPSRVTAGVAVAWKCETSREAERAPPRRMRAPLGPGVTADRQGVYWRGAATVGGTHRSRFAGQTRLSEPAALCRGRTETASTSDEIKRPLLDRHPIPRAQPSARRRRNRRADPGA